MRILHAVEMYSPSVGGAQEVVRQVSERLAQRGHDVSVATSSHPERSAGPIAGVDVACFDISGNAVRGIVGDVDGYRRFVRDGEFDVIMLYAAQQWATDALLPVLDEIPAAKILAPCGFSGLENPAYRTYFEQLAAALSRFDALILHSGTYQDHVFAQRAGAGPLHVVPNAADEREFGELPARGAFRAAHGIAHEAPMLLTVGGHTGSKGHGQAMGVLRASTQARQGSLVIVGNSPTGAGCRRLCTVRAGLTRARRPSRRVVMTDPPRAQVLEAYADADLFVFCSAVECSPLVLFEAMAAGLPFVSLDVGNAAEIAEWGGGGVIVTSRRGSNGLVGANTGDVTAVVDELLADPGRRRDLGARGREAWRQRFTWDDVVDRYERVYESVLA
jgi:glycosyltransferase involved in cell wall biosynthesis